MQELYMFFSKSMSQLCSFMGLQLYKIVVQITYVFARYKFDFFFINNNSVL